MNFLFRYAVVSSAFPHFGEESVLQVRVCSAFTLNLKREERVNYKNKKFKILGN